MTGQPQVQETDLVGGAPCDECGDIPADPYSGLCERCLFGPLDPVNYDCCRGFDDVCVASGCQMGIAGAEHG